MIDVNEIKKGDRFHILTNGAIAQILSVHHDNKDGELNGFMVEVTPKEGKEYIVPMSKEFYLDKIERFEKIDEHILTNGELEGEGEIS